MAPRVPVSSEPATAAPASAGPTGTGPVRMGPAGPLMAPAIGAGVAGPEPARTVPASTVPASTVPASTEPARTEPARTEPGPPETGPGTPGAPGGRRTARLSGLDGVRALAVLAVVAFHLGLPGAPGGFLGVDVFFVLSGYLITDLLMTRRSGRGWLDLRGFWTRRARRLLPALALMLVVVTAAVAILSPGQLPELRPALLAAVTYSSNWFQIFHHVSYFASFGPPPPLQHLWSLAVEEQFYLAWPLLLLALARLRGRWARPARAGFAWLAAIASAAAMALLYHPGHPSLVYYGTDTHATGLLIGAALAFTWPLARLAGASGTLARRLDWLGAAGLIALTAMVAHFSGADPVLYPLGLGVAALAAAALTAAAAAPGAISALLSAPPLRWLGVRSYGIYLWHWPVIAITAAIAGPGPAAPWLWPVEGAVAVALAAASWKWLEEPILRDGFRASCRAAWRTLAHPEVGWGSPAPRLRAAAAGAAVLAVVGSAGYGVLAPPPGPSGLQQQILRGEAVSAATRARPATVLTSPEAEPSPVRIPPVVTGRDVVAIGDSVLAASAMAVESVLPGAYIDAKPDRQMPAGLRIVRQLARAHRLRPVLVMALGTNYIVTTAQLRELLALIGPTRRLVLVNTYVPDGWSPQVNATDAAFVRAHPSVVLANWHKTIENRLYLLWPDHIHPMLAGTQVYARLIYRAVQATRTAPAPGSG